MYKRYITILLFFIGITIILPKQLFAQEKTPIMPSTPQQETYNKAFVIEILDEGEKTIAGFENPFQKVKLRFLDGQELGKEITIEHGVSFTIHESQKVKKGNTVIVLKTGFEDTTLYSIVDHYRLPHIILLILGFVICLLLLTGKKGIGAIIGLGLSIFILIRFLVPQILLGANPLTVSIVSALLIMIATIYIAHGFSKQTTIAVIATAFTLTITGILAIVAVWITKSSGMGNEYNYMLQFGSKTINLQGILLGSILIGALGVLDDITTSQTATIFELAKANTKLTFRQLATSGFNVGREHILSLVNTLVLAYAGASLGLFILLVLNPTNQPYWVILNSEQISEEIIRALVGSSGLLFAVPITTLLAAWYVTKKTKKES